MPHRSPRRPGAPAHSASLSRPPSDESALVVQFNGDGALLALTYTSYDEAGDLNYGVSGALLHESELVWPMNDNHEGPVPPGVGR